MATPDARALAHAFLATSPGEFAEELKHTPLSRAKLVGLKRNAASVLANVGTIEDLPALMAALAVESDTAVLEAQPKSPADGASRFDARVTRSSVPVHFGGPPEAWIPSFSTRAAPDGWVSGRHSCDAGAPIGSRAPSRSGNIASTAFVARAPEVLRLFAPVLVRQCPTVRASSLTAHASND